MDQEKVKKVAKGLACCKEWGMTEFDCNGLGCPYDVEEENCVAALHRDCADVLADALLPPPSGADYALMLEECVNRGERIRTLEKELARMNREIESGAEL